MSRLSLPHSAMCETGIFHVMVDYLVNGDWLILRLGDAATVWHAES